MVSAKLIPKASTRTKASPGLGVGAGTSRSSRTSGPPFRVTTSAFMLFTRSGIVNEAAGERLQSLRELSFAQTCVPIHFGIDCGGHPAAAAHARALLEAAAL